MKQGERKIGKQVFFFFSTRPADQSRAPTHRSFPRRDDSRARIRADEIPRLLSGSARFKIYPRHCVAFAIRKRRRGLDSLGGLGHKHASSIESCAGSTKFRCRVYNTASCLLNVLPKCYSKCLFTCIPRR